MKVPIRVVFVISLVFNALCAMFFSIALSAKNSSLTCYSMHGQSITAAAVVNVMDGTEVVFNPVGITMRRGEKASVQFSFLRDKIQTNYAVNAIYDRSIVSVTHTGYGIIITAITEGETILQTVTNSGIKDIISVTVK